MGGRAAGRLGRMGDEHRPNCNLLFCFHATECTAACRSASMLGQTIWNWCCMFCRALPDFEVRGKLLLPLMHIRYVDSTH